MPDTDLPSYEDLSEEQDDVFNLPLDGNYLVSGPPGTGKSVMALYRAQALSIDDRTTAMLMFNNVLKQYTQTYAEQLGVDGSVQTFHSWFNSFWRRVYRTAPPKISADEWAYDWQAIAEKFMSAPPEQGQLGDVIVDEGQDLSVGFYRLAHWLATDMTVFADENQQLREENTTLVQIERNIAAKEHLVLRRNYRNSVEIARLAGCFYSGSPTGIPDLLTRSRKPGPQLRRYDNLGQFVEFVHNYASGHSNLQIGIAAPTSRLQKKLHKRLSLRGLPVETYIWNDPEYKRLSFGEPGIKVISYASLKGLQFDTLFVPELQLAPQDASSASVRMRFYVILSRARNQLYLTYVGDYEPSIVADIPHDLLQRC